MYCNSKGCPEALEETCELAPEHHDRIKEHKAGWDREHQRWRFIWKDPTDPPDTSSVPRP